MNYNYPINNIEYNKCMTLPWQQYDKGVNFICSSTLSLRFVLSRVFLYSIGYHDSDRTAVLVWSPRLKLLYCKYHQFMYTLPNKDFLPSFLPWSWSCSFMPYDYGINSRDTKQRISPMQKKSYRQIIAYDNYHTKRSAAISKCNETIRDCRPSLARLTSWHRPTLMAYLSSLEIVKNRLIYYIVQIWIRILLVRFASMS